MAAEKTHSRTISANYHYAYTFSGRLLLAVAYLYAKTDNYRL